MVLNELIERIHDLLRTANRRQLELIYKAVQAILR